MFIGGTIDQLEMAAAIGGANGVWAQDPAGAFHLLVVRGPAFLKDGCQGQVPREPRAHRGHAHGRSAGQHP